MLNNIILSTILIVLCYMIAPQIIYIWNRNNFRRWLITIYQKNLINKKNSNKRIIYLRKRIAAHEIDIMKEIKKLDKNKEAKIFKITTNKYLTIKKEYLNNEKRF